MSGRPIARGPGRTVQPKGYARSTYDALFSQENRSVITAVGLFAAGVAFFHSSFSEILLPP